MTHHLLHCLLLSALTKNVMSMLLYMPLIKCKDLFHIFRVQWPNSDLDVVLDMMLSDIQREKWVHVNFRWLIVSINQ